MFIKVLKFGVMVFVIVLLMGCLTACSSLINSKKQKPIAELGDLQSQTESTNAPETSPSTEETKQPTPTPTIVPIYELTVWSYSEDLKPMAIAFMKTHPEVAVNYLTIPMIENEFQNSIFEAAQADNCPDVIAFDAVLVKEFVDKDMLMDLSDLKPYADELKTYVNTIEMGTNYETGEIRAYSYQNMPGAVFYRRSLAEEYFGTDDPAEIQALMSDMDKFTDMAKIIKEKSLGKTFIIGSFDEFSTAFLTNREQPWIVDDALVIDPIVDEYFNIAKYFRDNEYEVDATRWSQEWFSGMSDSLVDANGEPVQIFCYFLPPWGLSHVLMPDAPFLSGDWACCPGPLPYQWGGTWLGVMENAAEPDIAKEFIRFCALDEQNLTDWATGVYTNEYLSAINSELANSNGPICQPAGDFVSSQVVVEAIASEFDNCEMSLYLGGQNPYSAFALAAQNCSADIVQVLDDRIQNNLYNIVRQYVSGELTKKQAIASFKKSVKYLLAEQESLAN